MKCSSLMLQHLQYFQNKKTQVDISISHFGLNFISSLMNVLIFVDIPTYSRALIRGKKLQNMRSGKNYLPRFSYSKNTENFENVSLEHFTKHKPLMYYFLNSSSSLLRQILNRQYVKKKFTRPQAFPERRRTMQHTLANFSSAKMLIDLR